MNPNLSRPALAAALTLAGLTLAAPHAVAHATLAVGRAAPNAPYRGIVQINHGCAGAATTRVSARIPPGMNGVRPMPKAGWTLAITRGPLAAPYDDHGRRVTEGVTAVTWSGGGLPDDQYDEFVFVARMGEGVKPGDIVYVPIEQDCGAQPEHWVEIPAAGQSARDLKRPAPAIRIVAAATPVAPPVVTTGGLAIETPWLRATPGGAKVAGGYVRVTNRGTAPDRLVGATLPLAGRGEVHSMSMEGGIARMAPITGGLEVRPGESVELRPGANHLMFMDLTGGLKEGESLKGTLVFEKAGPVEVTFRVGGIGAQGPGGVAGADAAEHVH